jgi:hypothetical protein
MNTKQFKPLRPRMVAMPHKVLLTNTLVGTTSTDEVLAKSSADFQILTTTH